MCERVRDAITHMNELVLGVVFLGAALPVAVGLIYGLRLLLALVFVQILTQVQDPPTMVLEKGTALCQGVTNSTYLGIHEDIYK